MQRHDSSQDAPLLFGSEINLGGGGGPQVPEKRSEARTLHERAQANFKLCGMGAVAGAGMFSESYFLFALGNIKTLWHEEFPECYDGSDECNNNLLSSLTYIEVMGVIAGMLSFGYFADRLGRRWGSCSTALIMFLGGVLTTAAYAGTVTGEFVFFACALFLFAYGVGGEYPLASASATERAETAKKTGGYVHHIRGKSVVMTFAMQGVGNWVNTAVILAVLAGLGCTGAECSDSDLDLTWRLQYGIGAAFLLVLVLGRFAFLKESEVWKANQERKRQQRTNGGDIATSDSSSSSSSGAGNKSKWGLILKHYWHRLTGTALGWLVWDIVFYGNKLFQGTIIKAIIGGSPTIMETLEYTLLNATVALIGYYAAALCIDKEWMGRRRLQSVGFFFTFIFFLVCGVAYDDLSRPENIHWFQTIYYLSSFFGQFGPNCTTWLLPSELFPTEVRTAAHGVSAASGKTGALIATVLFTYGDHGNPLDPKSIFLVCAVCGIVGLAITELFIPDLTAMDLSHADERWLLILRGEEHQYHGDAIAPHFLSLFENFMGIHRGYDCCAPAKTIPHIETPESSIINAVQAV